MMPALHDAVAAILATLAACAWLGRNPTQDDADTAQCHGYMLDSLADADLVTKIDCVTERTLRDQLTIEQAMELASEAELAKMGTRRN